MKKILIALAIMPLLIVACSSSDDIDATTTDFDHNIQLLYGEWRATGVDVGGVTIDLTNIMNELMVTPTYVTFAADGMYTSEGVLGEGTGKYGTKGKTIHTSVGTDRVSFEMTKLNPTTANIRIDSKLLGLSIIPENTGMVTVILTKNYQHTIDFDYDVKLLHGEWRATSLEGVPDGPVDLTNPYAKATYVTFDKKGAYTTKGILGEGTGRYATKDKTIFTLVGKESLSFEVTALNASTAQIELNPLDVELGITLPEEIKLVTMVLTKQVNK